jgi:Family of unknown function (DUF6266)
MAKIVHGIFGGISGKIGNVVGGSWCGTPFIRTLPVRKKGPTNLQLAQQLKFKTAMDFVKPMLPLFRVTFRNEDMRLPAYHLAMKSTLHLAVTGEYPGYHIDYSQALVSRGELPNALSPAATSPIPGQVNFSWTDNTGAGTATATDKAILVLYSADRRQCIFTTSGANRNTGVGILAVTAFSGLQVHSYLAFISVDGKRVASSIYAGLIRVP